jgi:hypothetical protein
VKDVASSKQPPVLPHPVRITEQTWPDGTVPVVSVFSWAYNHVEFIRESIDSILIQETTFPVEIIIHDDASTDGTTEIIREYEAKYPHLFRNIIQTENQWSQGKSVVAPIFIAPRGELIALTHGDDYWNSGSKLQVQVNYLLENNSCSCCFHLAHVVNTESRVVESCSFRPNRNSYNTTECLLELGKQYATNSMLFRRTALSSTPQWMREEFSDAFMELQLSRHGSIDFLDLTLSCYRIHESGVWSRLSLEQRLREQLRRYKMLLTAEWIPASLVKSKIRECRSNLWRMHYPRPTRIADEIVRFLTHLIIKIRSLSRVISNR